MGALGKYLRSLQGGLVAFWCPGCNEAHAVGVSNDRGPRWIYNGNPEKPTFHPSVLTWHDPDPLAMTEKYRNGSRCHSFVTDGRIHFLDDCTHALAGQTVPLPEVPGNDQEH